MEVVFKLQLSVCGTTCQVDPKLCLTRCIVKFLFQERIVQDLSKLSKAEKIQVHINKLLGPIQ